MSKQSELREEAYVFAHVAVLFKTYQNLDENTREALLRSFRNEIRQGDAVFLSQFGPKAPRVLPEYRKVLAGSPKEFAPVFVEQVLQLLMDLSQPLAFDP